MVHWFILLSLRCINLQFFKQRVHAEGASFVGDDGNNALTKIFIAGHVAQQACEAHRGTHLLFATSCIKLAEYRIGWQGEGFAHSSAAHGYGSTKRASAFHHVLVFDAVVRWAVIGRVFTIERAVWNLVL